MSAPFDYESLRDLDVAPLIVEFGREFSLSRPARATTAAPIAGKPWRGTSAGDANPTAAAAQSFDLTGVFLSRFVTTRDGNRVMTKTQGVIALADTSLPEELGPEWAVDDGGAVYKVQSAALLRPGPTGLIYRLELQV